MPVRRHAYAPPPPRPARSRRPPGRRGRLAVLALLVGLAGALAMPLRVEAAGDLLSAIDPPALTSGVEAVARLSGVASEPASVRADLNALERPCATDATTNAGLAESVGPATPVAVGPFANAPATVTPAAGGARWVTLCAYLLRAAEPTTLGRIDAHWFVVEHAGDAPPPLPAAGLGAPVAVDAVPATPAPSPAPGGASADAALDTCRFGRAPRRPASRLRITCRGLTGSVAISAGRSGHTRWLERRLRRGRTLVLAGALGLSHTRPTRIEVWQGDRLIGRTSTRLER